MNLCCADPYVSKMVRHFVIGPAVWILAMCKTLMFSELSQIFYLTSAKIWLLTFSLTSLGVKMLAEE